MKPSRVNQLSINTHSDIEPTLQWIKHNLERQGLTSKRIQPANIYDQASKSVLISHYQKGDKNSQLDALLSLKKGIVHVLVLHDRLVDYLPLIDPLKQLIKQCDLLVVGDSDKVSDWKEHSAASNILPLPLPKPLPNVAFPPPSQSFRDDNVPFQLAFIGDLIPGNQPLVLLEALHSLRAMQQQNICLKWFYKTAQPDCLSQVQRNIKEWGLAQSVEMIDLSETTLDYSEMLQQTDIYTSLSSERNTGLLCAAQLKIPIVALHTPEQGVVYNKLGLRTKSLDAKHYAATLQQTLINPRLRSALIQNALNACQQLQPSAFYSALQKALNRLDIHLPKIEQPIQPEQLNIRIEGPYDSSYSLAIVNRELARALQQQKPGSVGLYATEGNGDYSANFDFLQSNPEIDTIAQQSTAQEKTGQTAVGTCLRLLYPPRVSGMQGTYNGLNLYGWEESHLPTIYIDNFNQHLQFSTTMSRYVSQTLRNNGCNLPLFTTGIGVDHILHSEADSSALPDLPDKLRLLHVSSCFPRKGVDVLLQAYGNTFNGADRVCLIIKTFANPHHDITQQLKEWQATLKDAPEVILINEDLAQSAIRALYQASDVLVGPSRGEGFGLPMAEAMLHDLPVITTGYGGQTDFCTEQTAWLIDYEFRRAESHISSNGSVWVEPSTEHLSDLLEAFYHAYQQQSLTSFCQQKVNTAKKMIADNYRWHTVAQRCQAAIRSLPELPVLNPRPKLAIVTSWNSKCGIATYSKLLIQPALADTLVLANKEENLTSEDDINVVRCWQSGSDTLEVLFGTIISNHIDQVLIQFNFSFFELAQLKVLLQKLHNKGVQTFLTLHSTSDVYWGDTRKSLQDLQPQLQSVERIFVHSIADLNQLKHFNLIHNVCLFPHGVQPAASLAPVLPESIATRALLPQDKTVIASYGFLLPHKGVAVLIEAFYYFLQKQPNSHLLLVTAEYPVNESREHRLTCQELIDQYQLTEQVTFITDFLTDEESQACLSQADCIVYPYQHTQESASGAVRWGLSLQKPVFCTPLAIFDDVANIVHFLEGTTAQQIADGIYIELSNTETLSQKSLAQKKWLKENDWKRLSRRLKNILSGVFLEKSHREQY